MNARNRVLTGLLLSPSILLPLLGGMVMVGVGLFGGGPVLTILGGVALLVGLGVLAGRLTFGLSGMLRQAAALQQDERVQAREAQLDQLERKLYRDRDRRTEEIFGRLRRMRAEFLDQRAERLSSTPHKELAEQINALFDACMSNLERSYDLYQQASPLTGEPRDRLLAQREEVVQNVLATTDHLARAVEQYHATQGQQSAEQLAALRREVDLGLEITRRSEERLAELGIERPRQTEQLGP